ncbi:uncharacterized protein B0H18DRAFT_277848 [Fomitopsis serialis]|uniref:uncharacterized protein n=1 Tax=Fomitopsis serialis TaxID=139415 RepID=UPI002007D46E|nr:uncharacterized protein B0H18DRAFT_277848 [Neoantrodia serialis]KAH9912078.1 hypothetical protein B0H18DRAFT_277848 [Neoantrodia serialis]
MIVKGRLGFARFWLLLPNSQQSRGSCRFKWSKAEPASTFSNRWVLRMQSPPASQPPRRPRSQIASSSLLANRPLASPPHSALESRGRSSRAPRTRSCRLPAAAAGTRSPPRARAASPPLHAGAPAFRGAWMR